MNIFNDTWNYMPLFFFVIVAIISVFGYCLKLSCQILVLDGQCHWTHQLNMAVNRWVEPGGFKHHQTVLDTSPIGPDLGISVYVMKCAEEQVVTIDQTDSENLETVFNKLL